jgi:hypothetical protein
VAVHEAVEDAGASGFADGCGNFRDCGVNVAGNNHTLMIDESLLLDNRDSEGYAIR